jgi:ABC-type polysaccharide/polyol phosphate transport system ATPase subunit
MSKNTTQKTSNGSSSIAILEDVHLVFKTTLHRSSSFRDVFTGFSKDPLGVLSSASERNHVIKGLNFSVNRSDRIGLLGVNGTGKTSLCRCISGHYAPTRGRVKINGRIQAVFDTAMGILPELTGRENAMLLVQFLYPHDAERYLEIVEEALDFSELRKFRDVAFKYYSNGMQARLYLSLISCLPTDLLILDEVFEGADTFFREKISKRIQTLIESSGAAIFVSHSPDQIRRVCNRVMVLSEGQLAYDGPVEEGIRFYETSDQRSVL